MRVPPCVQLAPAGSPAVRMSALPNGEGAAWHAYVVAAISASASTPLPSASMPASSRVPPSAQFVPAASARERTRVAAPGAPAAAVQM